MPKLAGKTFRAIANSTTTSDTTMTFTEEQGSVILGVYAGGVIEHGSIVAVRRTGAGIEMLYHCVTHGGELRAGRALGVFAADPKDGDRLHMYLDWEWLTGEHSHGSSEWALDPAA